MTRFRTYGVSFPAELATTADTLFSDKDFLEWEARPITDDFDFIDNLYPDS